MGVSFKLSRTGTGYHHKPPPATSFLVVDEEAQDDAVAGASDKKSDPDSSHSKLSGETSENKVVAEITDNDISFTLSLFPDGYSVGKPVENETGSQTPINVPKFLHPYDRASETLFSAVECGQFPRDILDNIPCKFIDGRAFCEVRDYRKCISGRESNVAPGHVSPMINRVCLKISLENIVKDIPSIADNDWAYGDLMEVESRILKTIQPQLFLDPTPQLDRLSGNAVPTKLNFELRSMRRKRLQQISQVAVPSDNKTQSKRVCLNRVMKDHCSGALSNVPMPSPGRQDMMNPFSNNGKRDNQDGESSPLTNKKTRAMPPGNLPHLGSQIENLHGSNLHSKNTLMQQQQSQTNNGVQIFSQQVFEGGLNQEGGALPFTTGQQGIRYNLKEEPVETDVTYIEQPRLQLRMQQQFMRSGFPHSPCNNPSQPLDNNSRKDDAFQKRKLVQSELVASRKDKSGVTTTVPGVNQSFTSSANDTTKQRQHQAQASAKRRSNSLKKTPGIRGVGPPAGTMGRPINAGSHHVGSQHLADQSLLDRFSKIEVVTMRYQPNSKKNKMDEFQRKPNAFSAQLLACKLSDPDNENVKDETCKMPLSKSLVGGNMNVCKTRILNFTQTEHVMQGNGQLVTKARTRMIMSEKPNDGAVAINIGEIDDADYLAAVDYLPTLPNTHMADLLAAQFCSLMGHDGYDVEDHHQPNPTVEMNHAPPPIGQPQSGVDNPSTAHEMQQFSEGVSVRQPSSNNKPSTSGNILPVNLSTNVQQQQQQQQQQGPRIMLPPANSQTPQIYQVQQNPSIQHQQQFQINSMQHLNNIVQNPNNIARMEDSKPSFLQLQLSQQQQPQMQRKVINNNMMGMGNFGNIMGLGGVRGIVSAPMGNILNQNPMNLSSASNISNTIRSGMLTPEQVNLLKMRMAQGRSSMLLGRSPQPGQMNPGPTGLPMFASAQNHRGNVNQMQQHTSAMGGMGPPTPMPGMNIYMNQQQQDMTSPLQRAVMSSQMGSPSMSQQQQASPQQIGQRTPMSPQFSAAAMHPASPQVSGSIGSINNSSMELQGANKN